MSGEGFLVVITLQPKPLPSLRLDRRFTRIDYTHRCTMLNVLEGMSRVLKVNRADLMLQTEDGENVILEQALAEYHDQHSQKFRSSLGERKTQQQSQRWPRYVKRQRRQINLIVRHTPLPDKLVTCTVEAGDELRRTTVQLPNTATFGELLVRARNQRHGGLAFEGPLYGKAGELDTTLKDAWARNGCKVDGTLHIGLAVVVSFPGPSQKPLPLVMGPSDTIGDVKQRVCSQKGVAPSRQSVTARGEKQKLEDTVGLKELYAAGVEVGRLPVSIELHLELVVKEIAFPSWALSKGAVGDGTDPSTPGPFAHGFFDTGKDPRVQDACLFLPPPPPPPPSGFAPKSDTHARAGIDSFVATPASVGRTATNSTQGFGCCVISLFVLSPSGRALALRVSGAGTVLHAKEQVATCEGVPPCQQRLLWRGVPLEPDHASLYKFGIRSGDTLVVGYRFPRPTLGTPTPADDEAEGEDSSGVVVQAGSEGATDPRESECVIHLKDDLVRQEQAPEMVKADGDECNAAREDEGTNMILPADAKTARGELDVAGRDASDGSDGSGGRGRSGGSGGSGGSRSSGGTGVPVDTAAVVQGHNKGSRRAWWSKKARSSRNVDRHERDYNSGGGVGGTAVAASSAGATHTHNTSPAPLRPARDGSGGTGRVGGLHRDTESTGAAPGYPLVATHRARQSPTPLAVRAHFSGWVRRKHGRRMPEPSASSADGGNGE